jgi:hypothetical protein
MAMIVMMGCDHVLGKSWRIVEIKAPLAGDFEIMDISDCS